MHEVACEAAIILDGREEVGDWKATFIETKHMWAVATAGEWVVEETGVCLSS